MKHNKKRNTAFIYETLTKELTQSIVDKNHTRKTNVVKILKEFFIKGTPLATELQLYGVLLETRNIQSKLAERLLQETKKAHSKLNGNSIFDAQSQLIGAINKQLGQKTWSNFISNFKTMASVNAIFNSKTSVKKKVLFEQAVVDRMSEKEALIESDRLQPLDTLTYNSFIKKFNEKYGCAVIVNTSFNVRGEPIVCTPKDAYLCFMRTEMDYLILNNYLLTKSKQKPLEQDSDWMSEFELD